MAVTLVLPAPGWMVQERPQPRGSLLSGSFPLERTLFLDVTWKGMQVTRARSLGLAVRELCAHLMFSVPIPTVPPP